MTDSDGHADQPGSAPLEGHDELAHVDLSRNTGLLSDLIAAASEQELGPNQWALIVDQAILLFSNFYVHLPVKTVLYGINPVRRLQLLRSRITDFPNDIAFFNAFCDILASVRDLHTNFLLPAPYANAAAFLPFQIEVCRDGAEQKYIVSNITEDLRDPFLVPGAEVLSWNEVPIARAVEAFADRTGGGNHDARLARALARLTVRVMVKSPPPIEEAVRIRFRGPDEGPDVPSREARFEWRVLQVGQAPPAAAPEITHNATALGDDLEGVLSGEARKKLMRRDVVDSERAIAAWSERHNCSAVESMEALRRLSGRKEPAETVPSAMPGIFEARRVATDSGDFAYLRIRTFTIDSVPAFVQEFIRLIEHEAMPQNGLIIDVRDNPGGVILAGEEILQLLTPRTIEPIRFQFVSTPASLTLCELNVTDDSVPNLAAWSPSVRRAVEDTGATFSAAFPISDPAACNAIGQRYHGPVVLIVNALCYSTTDIFAAGFQDHAIGTILGTHANTGAGGANVFTLAQLRQMMGDMAPGDGDSLADLPNGAGLRVALRRAIRVGLSAGTELEDVGVAADQQYALTRDDVLGKNAGLINRAGEILAGQQDAAIELKPTNIAFDGEHCRFDLRSRNLTRLDVYIDGRPVGTRDLHGRTQKVSVPRPHEVLTEMRLEGFRDAELRAVRRVPLIAP